MTGTGALLLRDVTLLGGRRADVRLAHGTIVQIGSLDRLPGEPVLDGGGAALSVGLADHHLHLLAMAAAADSVDLRSAADRAGVEAVLSGAVPDGSGWIRAVGYAEQGGRLTLADLDRLQPAVPVRVQHRSGALWLLNSAGLRAAGLESKAPSGELWRADARLAERLPDGPPPDLARIGRELAGTGITAVTDATPDLPARSQQALTDAVNDGRLPQRVMLLGGQPAALNARITLGPLKIAPADHVAADLEWMRGKVRDAREQGRTIAVHCVTREALAVTIAVLEEMGVYARDRIEHASLVDAAGVAALARLGLTVITQPGFIADRGDGYRRDLASELDDLYRLASLQAAGVAVACSSDAPYGPADPWAVIRAAAERRAPSGEVVGPGERVDVLTALRGYLASPAYPGGPPRRIVVGAPADMVLMHVPWRTILAAPHRELVRCTIYGGHIFGS
ncbi:MAG TPA: amidohydrolase family protein [Frankiaceae bacterium]|nr:amidohydrolase family protein [Frankiaceae bacterium]